jgi:hypothetical protein
MTTLDRGYQFQLMCTADQHEDRLARDWDRLMSTFAPGQPPQAEQVAALGSSQLQMGAKLREITAPGPDVQAAQERVAASMIAYGQLLLTVAEREDIERLSVQQLQTVTERTSEFKEMWDAANALEALGYRVASDAWAKS